ncbi:hypothetical protein RND71_008314 [Anisodus tanguticus]|uniref:Uncharacterized protein n=1 Tax=Anisodus tanguticus TaxID=243964 RepID=A0AAE1SN06_9SOLA|nr:hypothetical protein RND71_008314 [Anisodus tanguticus]
MGNESWAIGPGRVDFRDLGIGYTGPCICLSIYETFEYGITVPIENENQTPSQANQATDENSRNWLFSQYYSVNSSRMPHFYAFVSFLKELWQTELLINIYFILFGKMGKVVKLEYP